MRESSYPMVSVEDAIAAVLDRTTPLSPERVPLAAALGLVLAADVHAAAPQPPFGADEVAELAYLTLQETSLELAGVVDDDKAGEKFFGRQILPFRDSRDLDSDTMVITSYVRKEAIHTELIRNGVEKKNIHMIFPLE